jgi:hypothetical protein
MCHLFIVLSLFTLYLFLVGCVPGSFLRSKGGLLEHLGLTVAAGILINYCLMLTGLTIPRVFIAGTVLAFWAGWRLFRGYQAQAGPKGPALQGVGPALQGVGRVLLDPATVLAVCCIICVLVVYYFKIFSEPVLQDDARFIWFFHARMIWADGALRQSGGWNHPSIGFSNPDYPMLVPAIAAQLAYVKGYWNEFFPKGSLLVLLVPLTLWVFSFWQKSLSFILLVVTFFLSLGILLWVGYMDGYLAMYAGAAVLLFGRHLSEGRDTDLYSGMCALGIGASLKNEGLLFALCLVTALLFIGPEYPAVRLRRFATRLRTDPLFAKILLLAMAPTVLWTICKNVWGLQNDLARDPSAGVLRLWNRLFDGFTPLYLLNFMTVRATAIWMVIGLFAVTVMFSMYQGLKLHRGALVAATASALYFAGLYVVYLSSPHDALPFYLFTSATRTMTTGSVALLVGMFFLLSGLEVHEGSP